MDTIYYLGIDGGGTKCKARLEDSEGNFLSEAISGPANPVLGIELTIQSIMDSVSQAIRKAGLHDKVLSHTYAVLGLAGVNLPSYLTAMEQWQHPFAKRSITTDLHIACVGAHDGERGGVIIAGTGFNAGSTAKDEYFEIGGHGFVLGDSGSGARLGLLAVRKTLEYLDGLIQTSPLFTAILQKLECKEATEVVEKTIRETPGFYGQFAPIVFYYANKGDAQAIEIVKQVADYISLIAKRLLQDETLKLSMIGGIAEPIQPWLEKDIKTRIKAPLKTPEMGAIILARQKFL